MERCFGAGNPLYEQYHVSSFFVSDYIRCKAKLLRGDISSGDLSSLLQLEKYFSRFPSYYWSV